MGGEVEGAGNTNVGGAAPELVPVSVASAAQPGGWCLGWAFRRRPSRMRSENSG
jgi:hypothetical protein